MTRPIQTDTPLPERLVGFVDALRTHGLRVGTSETVEAARALESVGMTDRSVVRGALAATLTRRAEDRGVFDGLFELWFPPTPGAVTAPAAKDRADLLEQLAAALAANDSRRLGEVASAAVDLLGDVSNGGEPSWSSARTLDQLTPARAISRAEELAGGRAGSGSDGSGSSGSGSSGSASSAVQQAGRDRLRRGVAQFRAQVEAEALRRNSETRGRERVGRLAIRPTLDERDLLGASAKDLEELRRALVPLTRRLAARLAAKQRKRGRSVDIRRTLRRSLSTGGVPIDPVTSRRTRHKVDLVILADLSGSVGGFSTFTMLLVQALQRQFRKVRIFGFVSSPADLTELVRTAPPGANLTAWARKEPQLTARGGATSYGSTFRDFADRHLDLVTHRTVVLILGDARSNYGAPQVDSLRQIVRRSRRTIWLNPEQASSWGTGDSLTRVYDEVVEMHECRNLAQLRRFVLRELT